MNPLFKSQNKPDIGTMFQQFRQNPMKYLTGLDIPQGMSSPQQIVQYLANSGRIPPQLQGRVNAMLGKQKQQP